MPKEENAREPADPMELWEKWYETASRAWSNASGGSKETYMDPFIFYRTWMKNVGKVQELMQAQLKAGSFETMDPREAWKHWFETTTDFKDHICSLPQAQAIERYVSSTEIDFHVVDAGHVGLMTGSDAKKDVWPTIRHWLELRSK